MADINDIKQAMANFENAVTSLELHEAKAHDWVNDNADGYYLTDEDTPRQVETIPAYMQKIKGVLGVLIHRGVWTPKTFYYQNNLVDGPDGKLWLVTYPYTSSSDFDQDVENGNLVPYNTKQIGEMQENDSVFWLAEADVPTGGLLDLPISYRPGLKSLLFSYCGALCYPKTAATGSLYQYEETEADSLGVSWTLKVHFDIHAGDPLYIFIAAAAFRSAVDRALTAAQESESSAQAAAAAEAAADARPTAPAGSAEEAADSAAQAEAAMFYKNTESAAWDDPDNPVTPVPFDANAHIGGEELIYLTRATDTGLAGTEPLNLPDKLTMPIWIRVNADRAGIAASQTMWDSAGAFIYRRVAAIDNTDPDNPVATWGSYSAAGRLTYDLSGITLTRVIGGTTVVPITSLPADAVLVAGTTLIFGPQGSIGVYIGDADAATANVVTKCISPISSDEPTLLGRVATYADLPLTASDAQAVFGRDVAVDDYARVLADENNGGATYEYYITAVDAGDNITWGNEIAINTSDYQEQTTAADAGLVLVGGTAAGTFGASLASDPVPAAGSLNLIRSGATYKAIELALNDHNTSLAAHAALLGTKIRYYLTKDTTFYVRPDGNDLNDGSADTPASALKTIAGALSLLSRTDQRGYMATISLAPGNWPRTIVAGENFSGLIKFTSTDTDNIAFIAGLNISSFAVVQVGDIGFNSGYYAFSSQKFAFVNVVGPLTFKDSAYYGMFSSDHALIYFSVQNTPVFFDNFTALSAVVAAQSFGNIFLTSAVFSGTAIGRRYIASVLSLLDTRGKGPNFITGTIAGYADNGSLYL